MRTAAMVAALIVFAAACGGGGDNATSSPTAPIISEPSPVDAGTDPTAPPYPTCSTDIDCVPNLRTVTIDLWSCDGGPCKGDEDSGCQRGASLQVGDERWEPDPFFCLVQFHVVPVGEYLLSVAQRVPCPDNPEAMCAEQCSVVASADRIAVVPVASGECPSVPYTDYLFEGVVRDAEYGCPVDAICSVTAEVTSSLSGNLETGTIVSVFKNVGLGFPSCIGGQFERVDPGDAILVHAHESARDYDLEICGNDSNFVTPIGDNGTIVLPTPIPATP